MKKLLSILFLLIFVYNLAGYFVVFKLQQKSVRDEMKAFIKKNPEINDLEKVVVANASITSGKEDFRLLEDGREFTYYGKLYDIVRSSSDGKFTTFYCINDKREEQVFAQLNEQIKHNTDQNTSGKNNAEKLVKSMFKDFIFENAMKNSVAAFSKNIYSVKNFTVLHQYFPVTTPPPKA